MAISEPHCVAGGDKAAIHFGVEQLKTSQWALVDTGTGLQKSFYFKTYTKALVYIPAPNRYELR